jgi:hypothetical protein
LREGVLADAGQQAEAPVVCRIWRRVKVMMVSLRDVVVKSHDSSRSQVTAPEWVTAP